MNFYKKIVSIGFLLTSNFYAMAQDSFLPEQVVNEVIEKMIQDGNDLNIQDEEGNTLINILSRGDNVEGVELLVSAGADVSIPNDEGDTPLISVACYNDTSRNIEMAQVLLDSGAEINAQEELFDFTAAHCALIEEKLDLALFLIEQEGLDVSLEDIDGDDLLGMLEYMGFFVRNTEGMSEEQVLSQIADLLKQMIEVESNNPGIWDSI